MHVDLRQLRHAQALAAHGSFSRAAESLKIAQPTLSRSIKELESRVGLALFNRSRSGHEPTDFGRVFLEHAAELIGGLEDLNREVALAKGLESGEVSVGLGPYVVEALAPSSGARFAAAHPSVRLRILTDDPVLLARLLRLRKIDLCVADAGLLVDDEFEIVARLAPLPGNIVVRAEHPLLGKRNIGVAELLGYPFAQVVTLPSRMLKPILALRRPMRGPSQPPPFPAIECPTVRLALDIVANSNAFTIATLGMIRADLEARSLDVVLHEPWMHTEWNIVRLRKRSMSPAMIAIVAELERAHAEVMLEETVLRRKWYPVGGVRKGLSRQRR